MQIFDNPKISNIIMAMHEINRIVRGHLASKGTIPLVNLKEELKGVGVWEETDTIETAGTALKKMETEGKVVFDSSSVNPMNWGYKFKV